MRTSSENVALASGHCVSNAKDSLNVGTGAAGLPEAGAEGDIGKGAGEG